jgi:predicted RNA-binding protein with TRAM domain
MVDKFMRRSKKNAKNRRRRYARKCPVEVGDKYEVDITDITPGGTGMGIINGFLILIEDTKPGDHERVVITKTEILSAEAEKIP